MSRLPPEMREFMRNQRRFHEQMVADHQKARAVLRKSPIRVAVEVVFMHARCRYVPL